MDAKAREELVERVGKSICQEKCAFLGEPACWQLRDDDGGPYPWPAEGCDEPGCDALARAALAVIEPVVREACAKVAERRWHDWSGVHDDMTACADIAAAIRGGSNGG